MLDNTQPHVAASTPPFVSQPPHRDGLVRPSWMGGGGGGWQQHILRLSALQFGLTSRESFTFYERISSPSKGICGWSRVCTSSQQIGN
jgi:hypothetical protein